MPDNNSLTDKTIMIFGAGINQLELIKAARELGVTSVVIDPQDDPPGKPLADFFYRVDGKDYNTTKAIALKHHVNGIVTGQMEKPMRLMARLADELGYVFHKPDIVEQCLDKWLMKSAFTKNAISCARGMLIDSDSTISADLLKEYQFPLIIKPRDAFSSRGVFKVNSFDELSHFIEETRSFSASGSVILEEFLEGREFSVESITWGQKTTIIQYTEKFITPYPHTVEMAHMQPARLTDKEKAEISSLVISGIKALGITNSAAHTEVMLTRDGSKIIEIGARLGGDFISSYLTKASTGVNMDSAAIQVALRMKPHLDYNRQRKSMIQYFSLPVGQVVNKIIPFDDMPAMRGLILAHVFVQPGDTVMPIRHSANRPGFVIVEGETSTEVMNLAAKYCEQLMEKIVFQ